MNLVNQALIKSMTGVLRYLFWPRVKRDVSAYFKTCHTCQLTGKPNQMLKKVDCVGPLPRSKSGANCLLTECQSTRYPAGYPLRTITTMSVVHALSQFISIFGIPKVVQSDQGSNFSSYIFSKVLKQLRIHDIQASTYHAQSQGALERFHQMLKFL